MADALSIINLGLAKLGASRISSIAPPRSPLERHCADGWDHWRDSELEKRRWRFALAYGALTASGDVPEIEGLEGTNAFALPNDAIRPIREKSSRWEQRGQFLHAPGDKLTIAYIKRVGAASFPPSFIEVLASRVAVECVELATQSNTKQEFAEAKYREALNEAARTNAFIIGPENLTTNDEDDTWVTARAYRW